MTTLLGSSLSYVRMIETETNLLALSTYLSPPPPPVGPLKRIHTVDIKLNF